MKVDEEQDLIRSHLESGHFGTDDNQEPAAGEVSGDVMTYLNLEELTDYDGNPRAASNTQYENIKTSLRNTGSENIVLSVTRRPGETLFFPSAGGNTRLRCLRELFDETGDEKKYYWINCRITPWPGEIAVRVNHLVENDCRGDYNFWDRASTLARVWEDLSEEKGERLSDREFIRTMKEMGYPDLSRANLQRVRLTNDVLANWIPLALQGGLGPRAVDEIFAGCKEMREFLADTCSHDEGVVNESENCFWRALASLDDADPKSIRIVRVADLVFEQIAPLVVTTASVDYHEPSEEDVERGLRLIWMMYRNRPADDSIRLVVYLEVSAQIPAVRDGTLPDRTVVEILHYWKTLPAFLVAACPSTDLRKKHVESLVIDLVVEQIDQGRDPVDDLPVLVIRDVSTLIMEDMKKIHPNTTVEDVQNALAVCWNHHESRPGKPVRQIGEFLWGIADSHTSLDQDTECGDVGARAEEHATILDETGSASIPPPPSVRVPSQDQASRTAGTVESRNIDTVSDRDRSISVTTEETRTFNAPSGAEIPSQGNDDPSGSMEAPSREQILINAVVKQAVSLAEDHDFGHLVKTFDVPAGNGYWVDLPDDPLKGRFSTAVWWWLFDLSTIMRIPEVFDALMSDVLSDSTLARLYRMIGNGKGSKKPTDIGLTVPLELVDEERRPEMICRLTQAEIEGNLPRTNYTNLVLTIPDSLFGSLTDFSVAVRSLTAFQNSKHGRVS